MPGDGISVPLSISTFSLQDPGGVERSRGAGLVPEVEGDRPSQGPRTQGQVLPTKGKSVKRIRVLKKGVGLPFAAATMQDFATQTS